MDAGIWCSCQLVNITNLNAPHYIIFNAIGKNGLEKSKPAEAITFSKSVFSQRMDFDSAAKD